MGTPAERKALLFLALIAVLGAAVRAIGAPSGEGTTDVEARTALRRQMIAVDSARRAEQEAKSARSRKPTARAERASSRSSVPPSKPGSSTSANPAAARPAIDVDMASAEELDQLPGIGPALALRIVEDRNRNGPFGSIEGLQRVKGIGPALSNRLTPHVTFSGTPRPTSADLGGRSRATGAGASAASSGPARPVGRMSIPP